MEKQKLIILRNFLLKTFIVGVLFTLAIFALTSAFWETACTLVYSIFHVSGEELGKLVVTSFLALRFYLVFIILVPAIGLHWTIVSAKT